MYILCISAHLYLSVYMQACIDSPWPQDNLLARVLTEGSVTPSKSTMAIKWKEPDAKDRLLAAVIAASSNVSLEPLTVITLRRRLTAAQLDMNEVARLFGQGATYDAVEGQLRKAKKAAAALKEEAVGRSGPATTRSRAKKTKNANGSLVKTRE